MSTDENKQLVLRWKDEIWNKRNLAVIDSCTLLPSSST